MSRAKRIPRAEPTIKRELCPPGTIDDMLASTPPVEIGDGHSTSARRAALRFGPFTRTGQNQGARPGGSAPDKRTKVEPEPANIPVRQGGTKLL
jgi:hypothetical protein